MSRALTNKVKKETMTIIAKLIPDGRVIDRKEIGSRDHQILSWASKDHVDKEDHTANWYGIFKDEKERIFAEPDRYMLLFTTGRTDTLFLIPAREFKERIMPYIRVTSEGGFFFLVRKYEDGYFLPVDYVPKEKRNEVSEPGVNLSKYVNNLDIIGSTYEEYRKNIPQKTIAVPTEQKIETRPQDVSIAEMIQKVSAEDPTFLIKSIEEKLIILRYHQLKK